MPKEEHENHHGVMLNSDGTVYWGEEGIEGRIGKDEMPHLDGIDLSVLHSIETPAKEISARLQETIESVGVPDRDEYSRSLWREIADMPAVTSIGLSLTVLAAYTSIVVYFARRRGQKSSITRKVRKQADEILRVEEDYLTRQDPRGDPVFLEFGSNDFGVGIVQRLYSPQQGYSHIGRVEVLQRTISPELKEAIEFKSPRRIYWVEDGISTNQPCRLLGSTIAMLTKEQRKIIERNPAEVTDGKGDQIRINSGTLPLTPDYDGLTVH